MPVSEEHFTKAIEELTDLISQVSQKSDSHATNLTIGQESMEGDIENRIRKAYENKWRWLQAIITLVILVISSIGYQLYSHSVEQILSVQREFGSMKEVDQEGIRRLNVVEQRQQEKASRTELDSRLSDVDRRLNAIEGRQYDRPTNDQLKIILEPIGERMNSLERSHKQIQDEMKNLMTRQEFLVIKKEIMDLIQFFHQRDGNVSEDKPGGVIKK